MLKRWIEARTSTNTWLLDMEFLLSNYECQWGSGCKGINPQRPDLGCCANGAYMTEQDVELLEKRVPMLTKWQRPELKDRWKEKVHEKNRFGIKKREYETKTAIQDPKDSVSGCVFANDVGYKDGAGCALHIEALSRGESPIDWKPSICWEMPLVIEEVEELDAKIVHMYHWTVEDYPWFCSHDEISWVSDKPVYQTMAKELEAMLKQWDDPEAYELIKNVCDQAFEQSAQWRGVKKFTRPVPVTLRVL